MEPKVNLKQDPAYVEIQKFYDANADKINIQQLFQQDADRFNKFRFVDFLSVHFANINYFVSVFKFYSKGMIV